MYLELCSLLPTKYYSLSLINACMYHALSIVSNILNHAVICLMVRRVYSDNTTLSIYVLIHMFNTLEYSQ